MNFLSLTGPQKRVAKHKTCGDGMRRAQCHGALPANRQTRGNFKSLISLDLII